MIEIINRPSTPMCPLCLMDKPDVKLIKLSSDYLYGTFALCGDCRKELSKALISHSVNYEDEYKEALVANKELKERNDKQAALIDTIKLDLHEYGVI